MGPRTIQPRIPRGKMAKKPKNTELKILTYLRTVPIENSYSRKISTKTDTDYNYTLRILYGMEDKLWITKTKHKGKTYHKLTDRAPTTTNNTQKTKYHHIPNDTTQQQ